MTERQAAVLKAKDVDGKTMTAIAKELGVSPSRAKQIYVRATEIRSHGATSPDLVSSLTTRAQNCLCYSMRLGLHKESTKIDVLAALPAIHRTWRTSKNFGRATMKEIEDWLGVCHESEMDKSGHNQHTCEMRVKRYCPYCGEKLTADTH